MEDPRAEKNIVESDALALTNNRNRDVSKSVHLIQLSNSSSDSGSALSSVDGSGIALPRGIPPLLSPVEPTAGHASHRTLSLHSHASSVVVFNGSNFSEWCEQVSFYLGVLDVDLALLREEPTAIMDLSNETMKSYHKTWERSNIFYLNFMRMTIANNIKTNIPHTESAKEYLKFVEEYFLSANKSLTRTLLAKLMTMKFDVSQSMQQHVLKMTNIAAKLNDLGTKVDDSFLVQFILNSLPYEYGPFQINYNIIKDKWNVSELSCMLILEEIRLRKHGVNIINLMDQGASKMHKPKAKKFKRKIHAKVTQVANEDEMKKQKLEKCIFL